LEKVAKGSRGQGVDGRRTKKLRFCPMTNSKGVYFVILFPLMFFIMATCCYLLLCFVPFLEAESIQDHSVIGSDAGKNPFDPKYELNKLNGLIAAGKESADVFYNRGWVYEYLGDLEEAKKEYTRAIEIDEGYIDAYYNRGLIYMSQKEYEQAVEDFSESIALDPVLVDAYCNRGNAYLHLGKTDQALDDYDLAIEIDPEDPELYYNRAIVYLAMGEKEKAMEDLEKAAGLGDDMAMEYLKHGH